jgi:chromosomal replication initiator protein
MTLDADVAAYLAGDWCRNVRELEGALIRIEAYSTLSGRPITPALVREAFGPPAASGPPSVEQVIGEVCDHFHLSRDELASARRTARVALPRQVAMYLCRHHTDAPLNRIGAQLGGRDHSTVVHALGAIERRLERDAALRKAVVALQARLGC